MPGLIPSDKLEQIRAASDIVEVINSYLPLRKRVGANFVALCPFHKEKTPSFSVNPHRQIFHCFGCGKGGDVFTFVREYEHLSFIEAVRRLAERARIPLEFEQTPAQQQARFLKETLWQLHEQIAQRWQQALANDAAGQIARDYLAKRRVPEQAVRLFRLGYAPDAWDDTVNWAKSKGYDLAVVEQAGLIIRKEGETRYYDRFRGRLMFPICDEQGRVVGFSGRVLAGDEKTAKYVNSPETPIFTKGKVIYGLDKSKRALLDVGAAVVCEGQLDLIACFMAGVTNVVAPQGTALTADHCRVLKRYVEEVVLCFDSDTAGQNATARALDDLLASGLAVRVAAVPAPHDPDSFIKEQGAEAFVELLRRAEGFFDYLLNRLCAVNDITTDRGRNTVVRAMAEAVAKTGNAVLADTYAQKTALRLGVAADAIRAEFKRIPRQPAPSSPPEAASPASPPATATPLSPQERDLLKLLLRDDNLVPWAAEHLDVKWLQHPLARRIVERRLAACVAGTWRGPAAFAALLGEFEEPAAQRLITEAVAEKRELQNRAQQLIDIIKGLRNEFLDRQLAQLKRQFDDPRLPEGQRRSLYDRAQALRQAKTEELAPLEPPAPPAAAATAG
jgi:DNA primase